MNVTSIKTQLHMDEWAKLIEARQECGLSIKQWCKQNNFPESQYYYYLRKLRVAAYESLPEVMREESQFALVPKHARAGEPTITGTTNIKITFPNAVVEIGTSANEAQVRLTLEVLLDAQ